jgi:hypothetical protein
MGPPSGRSPHGTNEVAGTISGGKLAAQTNMASPATTSISGSALSPEAKVAQGSTASDKVGPDGPTDRTAACQFVGAKGRRISRRLKAAA